jgi:zinc transporter
MYELFKLAAREGRDGNEDVTWTDVEVNDEAGSRWLMNESGLSEGMISQLLNPGKFTRRENLEEGLVVNVCAISPASEAESDDTVSLVLFLDRNRVISVRSSKIPAIDEVRKRVETGTGPRTPLEFLAFGIICINKRLEPLITRMSEDTAEFEDGVLGDDAESHTEALNALRRKAFHVRRYLSPFQTLLRLVVSDPMVNATDEERRALDGAAELVERYLNAVEDCRERTMLLHDLIEARVSQTMARATYNLTIVATVFLPLTFVTGLLGMNVAGIPEEHAPWGFWIVVVCLIVLAIASWGWLRWNKWLIQA